MKFPFGPWEPDSAGVDTGKLLTARNVYPSSVGYAPIPDLAASAASQIGERVLGVFVARTLAGGFAAFAGTATKLYKLVSNTWTDYTRVAGGAYAVPVDEYWSFAQFGASLIAVNSADDPQVIDVDSGATNFSALGGSPPKARFVKVVGDFVVLAALATNPRKVRNSAINDSTGWTVGTDLCDEQEFPDGGRVTGLAGGEFGVITQEKAIRRMIFQPGSDIAFRFEIVDQEHGCAAGYGLVSVGKTCFFPSDDGFYALTVEGQLLPIGAERINKWFRENSDTSRYFSVLAFADPYAPRVYWAFYSSEAATNFDRLLIYDWKLDRFSYAEQEAQFWASSATSGITLEDLDALYPSGLESIPYSLDSRVWEGGRAVIAGIDSSGYLSFLEGSTPMDATLTTCERQLDGGGRVKISEGVYPLGEWNGATLGVRVARREHTSQSQTTTSSVAPSTLTGWARMIAGGRFHQFEFTITQSSGTLWKHAQGYDVRYMRDGQK